MSASPSVPSIPRLRLLSIPSLIRQKEEERKNESYLGYIELYSKQTKFKQHLKRGSKLSYWTLKLKVNDKLDIYDKKDKGWHIGTITKIEKITTSSSSSSPSSPPYLYSHSHLDSEYKAIKLWIHYDGWSTSYDEIVTIQLNESSSSKLRKLHTYTPIHNNPECKWTKSSEWRVCYICRNKFCTKCAIISIKMYGSDKKISICSTCSKQQEKDIIYSALYEAINSIISCKFMDINIIHLITFYSTGTYAVCCNNTDISNICKNEISCDSRYQFEMLLNYEKNKIYHYIPSQQNNSQNNNNNNHDHELMQFEQDEDEENKYDSKETDSENYSMTEKEEGIKTQEIYDEYRRIFCTDCTRTKLKKCKGRGCNNREIYLSRMGSPICASHPNCIICNKRVLNAKECTKCHGYYHNNCGNNQQCKNCFILCEKQEIVKVIADSLENNNNDEYISNHKQIMEYIADYAMGYVVSCCNKPSCNNLMIIDNKWQLINNIDTKNNRIYYYKYDDQSQANNDNMNINTVKLYNDKIRLFCTNCTQSKVVKCIKYGCNYKEINLFGNQKNKVCIKHRNILCESCDKIESSTKLCNHCNNLICSKCDNTAKLENITPFTQTFDVDRCDIDYLQTAKNKITAYGTILYNEETSIISLALKEKDMIQTVVDLIREYNLFSFHYDILLPLTDKQCGYLQSEHIMKCLLNDIKVIDKDIELTQIDEDGDRMLKLQIPIYYEQSNLIIRIMEERLGFLLDIDTIRGGMNEIMNDDSEYDNSKQSECEFFNEMMIILENGVSLYKHYDDGIRRLRWICIENGKLDWRRHQYGSYTSGGIKLIDIISINIGKTSVILKHKKLNDIPNRCCCSITSHNMGLYLSSINHNFREIIKFTQYIKLLKDHCKKNLMFKHPKCHHKSHKNKQYSYLKLY